jgi:phosphoglycerate dehydrogenase-like enzyme
MNEKGVILVALSGERMTDEVRERFTAAARGREILFTADESEIADRCDDIEIVFGDPPFALLVKMPRLKWVQQWWAGADWLQNFTECKDRSFILTTTSGMHAVSVTEHVFALLLARLRGLETARIAQKRHDWYKLADAETDTLAGKSMLIAGYGAIGHAMARVAMAFGMRVTGLRRHPDRSANDPLLKEGLKIAGFDALSAHLPAADYIVAILPATPATAAVFGEAEFKMMKPSAVFVDVGRGSTVDEAALIRALQSKELSAAMLDVFAEEPIPPDSPLWDMENVSITAHYAGSLPDYSHVALSIALENLRRWDAGEALRNVVDKQAGY